MIGTVVRTAVAAEKRHSNALAEVTAVGATTSAARSGRPPEDHHTIKQRGTR